MAADHQGEIGSWRLLGGREGGSCDEACLGRSLVTRAALQRCKETDSSPPGVPPLLFALRPAAAACWVCLLPPSPQLCPLGPPAVPQTAGLRTWGARREVFAAWQADARHAWGTPQPLRLRTRTIKSHGLVSVSACPAVYAPTCREGQQVDGARPRPLPRHSSPIAASKLLHRCDLDAAANSTLVAGHCCKGGHNRRLPACACVVDGFRCRNWHC